MSVTLSEVTRAAKAHRAPLAGESAGYLVLAIADQVLSAPRLVHPGEIQLGEDGGVRVLAGRASSDADAELGLRQALDSLLLVASSGSAALTRAGRRASPVGLAVLVRELEAALIPVNRAAARRALARLHRETARALASGALPAEDATPHVEIASPPAAAAPVTVVPAAVVPAAATPVAAAPVTPDVPPAAPPPVHIAPRTLPGPRAPEPVMLVITDDSPAARAAAPAPPELPLLPQWDAMLTALCEESPEPEDQSQGDSDALTVALEVRACTAVAAAPLYEEDVEFDELDLELQSAEPPTVIRDAPVAPIAPAIEAELSAVGADAEGALTELPLEACTRPEPVVLRKAMRPVPAEVVELTELAPMVGELGTLTPILGSMVMQLPVLPPEQIAQLCVQVECEPSAAPLAVQPAVEAPKEQNQVLCSAAIATSLQAAELAAPTERAPEVEPLSPSVAIVASRKSEISELVQSFQVAEADSTPGLRRAIKEMAELDLTPAPFAALLR